MPHLRAFITSGVLATAAFEVSASAHPIVMPNVVEQRHVAPPTPFDFAQQGEAQPNVIWAIYIVGWVLTAAGTYVECAKSPQCVDTSQRLWRWITGNTNRQVATSDPGYGVETLTFTMSMQDVDGDGDLEYVLDSTLEQGADSLHETADDENAFHANIIDEARRHHAWLLAHNR